MVSKEEVRHLAWLSRIELSEAEVETYALQIESIIRYFDRLDRTPLGEIGDSRIERLYSDMRQDEVSEFPSDPLGTKYRKDGYVKGPRMT